MNDEQDFIIDGLLFKWEKKENDWSGEWVFEDENNGLTIRAWENEKRLILDLRLTTDFASISVEGKGYDPKSAFSNLRYNCNKVAVNLLGNWKK